MGEEREPRREKEEGKGGIMNWNLIPCMYEFVGKNQTTMFNYKSGKKVYLILHRIQMNYSNII